MGLVCGDAEPCWCMRRDTPATTFNLKDGTSGKEDVETASDEEERTLYDSVMYFQPNLTLFYVVDFNCYPRRAIPGDVYRHLRSSQSHQQVSIPSGF